jgi:hypothetical protein
MPDTSPGDIEVRCFGCGLEARVDLAARIAVAGGRRRDLTYADADLAVWDCPACNFTNAEDLGQARV